MIIDFQSVGQVDTLMVYPDNTFPTQPVAPADVKEVIYLGGSQAGTRNVTGTVDDPD